MAFIVYPKCFIYNHTIGIINIFDKGYGLPKRTDLSM